MSIRDTIAGERFADHLQEPGTATTLALAAALDAIGESRSASLLRRFADHGESVVAAPWWESGSSCYLGMTPPTLPKVGQLWFDPMEVALALIVPLSPHAAPEDVGPGDLNTWVSVTAAASWQIAGVHQVAPALPPLQTQYTGEQSFEYAALFGKEPTSVGDWLNLKNHYGQMVVDRLWGREPVEYGCGAAISGQVELITLDGLRRWTDSATERFDSADDLDPRGFAFRTATDVREGLDDSSAALLRTWSA